MPGGHLSSGKAFVCLDRRLDQAKSGPLWLKRGDVAQIVVTSIELGEQLGHYRLDSYVIMRNHVHLLIWPEIAPDRLLKSLKGATAREANRLLDRTGETFWQKESYDHWVRDSAELAKIRRYIAQNPVTAGVVAAAGEYPWSSAGVETSLDAARKSACATQSPSA